MIQYLNMALPKFSFLLFAIKKPIVLILTAPVVVVLSQVVSFEGVFQILGWMCLGDLVTGLYGSFCTWKKSDHKDRWFFGKGEGFTSDKAKKMGVKIAVYLSVPLLLIHLQKTLLLKNFKYESFSDAEFEWATAILILFCLIEGFSIFHENLPKCGFNLWKSVKKMIGFYKEFKNEIND